MVKIVHNHVNNVNKISIVRIYEKNLTIYVLLALERKLKNNVNKLTTSMMLLYDFVNHLSTNHESLSQPIMKIGY
jgi:hypothetical protein